MSMSNTAIPNNEIHIKGPPGSGKTHWMSRQLARAQERDQPALVASLSRAAAAEIQAHNPDMPLHQIRTIHSHCYQLLNRPQIFETTTAIRQWNRDNPQFALNPQRLAVNLEEADAGVANSSQDHQYPGQALYQQIQYHRVRRHPMPQDNPELGQFILAYNQWKQDQDCYDFNDLVEVCLNEGVAPANDPRLILVDEAQDLNALELTLLRAWAANAQSLALVGDPDQSIYQWRGAEPSTLHSHPDPERRVITMQRSHRLPRAVHAHAIAWLRSLQHWHPTIYQPTNQDGQVTINPELDYQQPDTLLEAITNHTSQGHSVMVLASCSFMLQPLLDHLRQEGHPFGNPYRPNNRAWNPIPPSINFDQDDQDDPEQPTAVTGPQRLIAFLNQGLWTLPDLIAWTEALRASAIFKQPRGGRQAVLDLVPDYDGYINLNDLYNLLTDQALEHSLAADLDWFKENLLESKRTGLSYPLAVVRNHGPEALVKRPQIIPGTIHSVKGGEADVVYILPDLSQAQLRESSTTAGLAAMHRLYYVAMTRAKHELVCCGQAEPEAAPIAGREVMRLL